MANVRPPKGRRHIPNPLEADPVEDAPHGSIDLLTEDETDAAASAEAQSGNPDLATLLNAVKFLIADNIEIKKALAERNRDGRDAQARSDERPIEREQAREGLAPGEVRGRNGEILSRRNLDSINPFELPDSFVRSIAEDGYTLEWKRESTYGEPNDSYLSDLRANGWTFVPASRLPGRFSANPEEEVIRHQGMVLMERPTELVYQARREEAQKARAQVIMKHKSWGVDSVDEAVFNTTAPNAMQHTLLRKTVEPSPAAYRPTLQVAGDDE